MNNNIRDILDRLDAVSEGSTSPVSTKKGLTAQQKLVNQLPALFKPRNISPVLGAPEKKAPTAGYFVGGEGQEHANEDVISSVKKKLGDYLQDIAQAVKKDPDLLDPMMQGTDTLGPAVKTITTDDGHEIKIHGNEDDGFRISIKNQPSKSKFENLAHAEMACEMFCNRRRQAAESADYIEERS